MPSSVHVVWFKRDLRIADHRPLLRAAAAGPVVALYADEPGLWAQPDASERHRRFIADSLGELDRDLKILGVQLTVVHAPIEETLEAIRDAIGDFTLWSHEETGNAWSYARDRRVAAWCRGRGVAWVEVPQHGVVRGLRDRSGWSRRWESRMTEALAPPPPAVAPVRLATPGSDLWNAGVASFAARTAASADADEASAPFVERRTRQRGGRDAGLRLLESFLARRSREYRRALSTPRLAFDSCSRLSAHLAYGTLSMREVVQRTRMRMAELDPADASDAAWRRSLSAFLSRMHWHCHFMQKLETAPAIEFENLHRGYDGLREDAFDEAHFRAWCEGMTGLPFVDACMRALIAGGWMNFRMRAMLCSFAANQLWLHWRRPAIHLARLFTDYEPGIHYSQMQMQSGTTGINTIRMYNPVKQGHDQDPAGVFIRRWCPELASLPDALLHEPWLAGAATLRDLDIRYPAPIVDHTATARRARELTWGVRRGDIYAEEAHAIASLHGSRKSGLRPPGKQRTSRRRVEESPQTVLPFLTQQTDEA